MHMIHDTDTTHARLMHILLDRAVLAILVLKNLFDTHAYSVSETAKRVSTFTMSEYKKMTILPYIMGPIAKWMPHL